MKRLILILASMLAVGCSNSKEPADAQPGATMPSLTPVTNYAIKDVWEFYDVNGNCDSGEFFGDPGGACVKYAQLTRFEDGSSFFSIAFGNGYLWTFNEFIQAADQTFTRDFAYAYGAMYMAYEIKGNVAPSTPTLSVNFDNNHSFLDTAAKTLTLTKVQ